MIMYDFECSSCGHKFEELMQSSYGNSISCLKCGSVAHKIYTKMPYTDLWRPITTDHINGHTKTYNTKAEFVDDLHKHNLGSQGLHNSYNAHHEKKWY